MRVLTRERERHTGRGTVYSARASVLADKEVVVNAPALIRREFCRTRRAREAKRGGAEPLNSYRRGRRSRVYVYVYSVTRLHPYIRASPTDAPFRTVSRVLPPPRGRYPSAKLPNRPRAQIGDIVAAERSAVSPSANY